MTEDQETRRIGLARQIAEHLVALRNARPLVQNITNFVSMDIAANALLAAGASPAMVHAAEEIDEFGALISALVINIGTLSSDWVPSMRAAAESAHRRGKPWVLDPVGAGATAFRNRTIEQLIEFRPSVIRGNASEILSVAAIVGLDAAVARGKGVDSGNSADEVMGVAGDLAARLGCTVVATGEIDIVSDGKQTLRFANGSMLMTLVTAIGCSLSALTAAYCAVADPFSAACAAVAHVGIAGELAGDEAMLPGMFRVAFIDRLASISEDDFLLRFVAGMRPLDIYGLCLVTDRGLSRGRSLSEVVAAAIRGGVTMVQLREKTATTRAFLNEARALRQRLAGRGIPLIVNDRVDIAMAIDADGVHVGQSDMPVSMVRDLIGPDKLIGLSITDAEQVLRPDAMLADYLGIGPIHAQQTKQDASAPLGIDGFARLRRDTRKPVVAIGGVKPADAGPLRDAGADGLAVVSAIMSAEDPEAAARAFWRG